MIIQNGLLLLEDVWIMHIAFFVDPGHAFDGKLSKIFFIHSKEKQIFELSLQYLITVCINRALNFAILPHLNLEEIMANKRFEKVILV